MFNNIKTKMAICFNSYRIVGMNPNDIKIFRFYIRYGLLHQFFCYTMALMRR